MQKSSRAIPWGFSVSDQSANFVWPARSYCTQEWAVEVVAKAGTISIIGVYGENVKSYPIGKAMNKNLGLQMGNCNHRRYLPLLIDSARSGALDPSEVLTNIEPMTSAIEAYKSFDKRETGWIKVMLEPRERAGRA